MSDITEIRKCIGLLSSMIRCGDTHTTETVDTVQDALKKLDAIESAQPKAPTGRYVSVDELEDLIMCLPMGALESVRMVRDLINRSHPLPEQAPTEKVVLVSAIKNLIDDIPDSMRKSDSYYQGRDEVLNELISEAITLPTAVPESEWISVEDRLPENDDTVLVWYQGDFEFGMYRDNILPFDLPDHGWDHKNEVTHWMPIPPLDKEPG